MTGSDSSGPLGRVIDRLKHPILLYGLGSVLVVSILLTAVIGEVNLIVLGAALVLLLASLAAALALSIRQERTKLARQRTTGDAPKEDFIIESKKGLRATNQSRIAVDHAATGAMVVTAKGDIIADGGSEIGVRGSAPDQPPLEGQKKLPKPYQPR